MKHQVTEEETSIKNRVREYTEAKLLIENVLVSIVYML